MLGTNHEVRTSTEGTLIRALGVLFVALSLATAVGCGGRNEGPVEEAAEDVGEAVDEAVEH